MEKKILTILLPKFYLSVTANINWIVSTWPNKRFLSHGMLPLSGHDDVALFEWRRLWRWINTNIKNTSW